MSIRNILIGLPVVLSSVLLMSEAAQAITNVVIANNYGKSFFYNGTLQLEHGSARWSELPLTLDQPEDNLRFVVEDTGASCGASGYVIRTRKYGGGSWAGDYDFCIDLSPAEIGCLAMRIDSNASVAISKASGTHCSNQWFSDRSNEDIFSTISDLAGAAAGFIP